MHLRRFGGLVLFLGRALPALRLTGRVTLVLVLLFLLRIHSLKDVVLRDEGAVLFHEQSCVAHFRANVFEHLRLSLEVWRNRLEVLEERHVVVFREGRAGGDLDLHSIAQDQQVL